MNIALLNVKISFQEATASVDSVGNTVNAWQDSYTCHATVSGESGKEDFTTGTIQEHDTIAFTVRYSNYTKAVTSTGNRIKFSNDIYNIVGIDHQNYKKKSIKFICKRERY